MRLDDRDLEIIDLRGRINGLEIIGKRYEQALQKIVREGDYTAPEGMTQIAKEALGSDSAQQGSTKDDRQDNQA